MMAAPSPQWKARATAPQVRVVLFRVLFVIGKIDEKPQMDGMNKRMPRQDLGIVPNRSIAVWRAAPGTRETHS
ncbi:hypothetical protein CRBSH125_07850 [Afipia carboxidovorans]|nr:hypothetical protein CRBSH125_07850 [Afipia carboxidovorans]